jgi:cytochrome c-type biogenesis protein CcmH
MSPFCPGLLLTNCPSSQAAELRDWVRMQLAAGTSRDAILKQLEAAYGEEILAVPRRRGLGLVAWMAPGVFVAGGAVVLLVRLARLSKRGRGRRELAPLDREAQAVVDAELTRL